MDTLQVTALDGATTGVLDPPVPLYLESDRMHARAVASELLGDLDVFADAHWNRTPLLRRGAATGAQLSVADVERIMSRLPLPMQFLRCNEAARHIPFEALRFPDDHTGNKHRRFLADPMAVRRELRAGATLAVFSLQQYWPPLRDLVSAVECALTHPAQVNAYLSPPTGQGFSVHHDTHDVIVVVTSGRKHFEVFPPVGPLPYREEYWGAATAPSAPLLSIMLEPGDVLYMPRGFPHRATTEDEHSLHFTIGVFPLRLADILDSTVAQVREHESMRSALPVEFAADPYMSADMLREGIAGALTDAIEAVRGSRLAEAAVAAFIRAATPPIVDTVGLLPATEREITAATRVQRRPLVPLTITTQPDSGGGGAALLQTPSRTVPLAAAAAAAITPLLSGGTWAVGELDGFGDDDAMLDLIRDLCAAGVVEIVGRPASD